MISKKAILLMALATIVVFGGLGAWLVPVMRDVHILIFLQGTKPIYIQLFVGTAIGIITAMAGWQIVELPFMLPTKIFFVNLIKPIQLSLPEILFISICAGVGEELFFRGAVQPYLGVWITSFLFVLFHGYINPFNLPLTVYGIYMVLVIGVLGLFTEFVGIGAAMVAHTFIDVILIFRLSKAEIPKNDAEIHEDSVN
jgi:uncharacterized protein